MPPTVAARIAPGKFAGNNAPGKFAGNNTVRRKLAPVLYRPTNLDTDQWMEAAKAAGAR